MKTSIKKVAMKEGIKYSLLRQVVSGLDVSIVEIKGKAGIIIHDLDRFNEAIADLPREKPLDVSIVPVEVEPRTDHVIDAEIVSESIDSNTLDYIRQLDANRHNLSLAVEKTAIAQGQQLGNVYKANLIKTFISSKQETDSALLDLLGK